jgi:hypothetical protein
MNLLEVSLRPKDNEEKDGATIRHVVVVLLSKVINIYDTRKGS